MYSQVATRSSTESYGMLDVTFWLRAFEGICAYHHYMKRKNQLIDGCRQVTLVVYLFIYLLRGQSLAEGSSMNGS